MLSPILVISASEENLPLYGALGELGIRVEQPPSIEGAMASLASGSHAAIVVETKLLRETPAVVEILRGLEASVPLIVLGLSKEAGEGVVSSSDDAFDPLPLTGIENVDLARLVTRLKQLVPELRTEVLPGKDVLFLKSANQKMRDLLALVDILKDESANVLVQGENGVGKEFIAWLLHYSGRRHATPMVAINCAAIPETLLESELFGHEKGSFTGATEKRIGKFELADKGTAFLDEIGDMPLNTQAKILRVIETGVIERVGGHRKIPVDLRFVAATNQDLWAKIQTGQFRKDLYYRINTLTLRVPPLRERSEDIPLLGQHFLDMTTARRGGSRKRLSKAAEQLLLEYDWPGNVRELRNAMERAAILTAGDVVGVDVLPREMRWGHQPVLGDSPHPQRPNLLEDRPRDLSLEALEKQAIVDALSACTNNVSAAAVRLGISKATLYRKLKRYRIPR